MSHVLGLSLFGACLYAVFAQGAIRTPQEPRLQVGVAVIATLASAAWLWSDRLSLRVSRSALIALGLLFAFCVWSALSLAWSIDPDGTWVGVNRLFTYTLVLGLALALGASDRDAVSLTGRAIFVLALVLTGYALAQKIVPGLHIAGLIDLDQTGQYARLQEPLGYWNALALALSFGAPVALTRALRPDAGYARRLTALVLLELIVLAVGFTESRGGFIALAVALGACVLLSPDRLVTLAWAALAVGFGVVDLVIALSAHPLSADGVALPRRELAGLLLLAVLAATTTLSALVLPLLDQLGPRLTQARRRVTWRMLGAAAIGLIVAALGAAALSARGLTEQVSHLWAGFNHADSLANSGATRLLSDSSANRVDWWGQALAAFAQRPLNGFGAGSFPVINMLFRHNAVAVQDAHSVPLQWLAETGLVGAGLALAAWLILLRLGVRAVRGSGVDPEDPTGLDTVAARRRLSLAALLAPALAYSVHALFDWDWGIPGVTLPVLIMLGVLAGSRAQRVRERRATVIEAPAPLIARDLGPTLKLIALGLITAVLSLFAVSAVLPGLAATKATAALTDAGAGTPASLAPARHEAATASALDPLSPAGLLASANVALAQHVGQIARDDVIKAIRRQPSDESAWATLVSVDLRMNRDAEAMQAAQHALALDPEMDQASRLSLVSAQIAAEVAAAPPQDSASAVATPGV